MCMIIDWHDLQFLEFRSQTFFEDIHLFDASSEEYNLENSFLVSIVDHCLAYFNDELLSIQLHRWV